MSKLKYAHVRVAKTERMPYHCTALFPKKSPVVSGSFAERDLRLKASCETLQACIPCEQIEVCICEGGDDREDVIS